MVSARWSTTYEFRDAADERCAWFRANPLDERDPRARAERDERIRKQGGRAAFIPDRERLVEDDAGRNVDEDTVACEGERE